MYNLVRPEGYPEVFVINKKDLNKWRNVLSIAFVE